MTLEPRSCVTNTVTVNRVYKWYAPEALLLRLLARHETILELGSGTGRFTALLPRVIGLELHTPFLRYCRRHVKGAFVRADAFYVPFKTGAFACVFSSGLVEHYADCAGIIREQVRTCKKGGVVIVTAPAKDSLDFLRAKRFVSANWRYYGRRLADNELKLLLRRAGLSYVRVFHWGTFLRGYYRQLLQELHAGCFAGILLNIAGLVLRNRMFQRLTACHFIRRHIQTGGFYLCGVGVKC